MLYYGTNLAARNDGTTIGDVVGVYITFPGCNRKTPLVKLETVNKHYREMPEFKKNSFYYTNKSKNMLSG